jgi:hypothetical protein
MNIVVDVLVVGIGCFAAYLVYLVAEQALKNFSLMNSRKVIPLLVAMLTLLSIVELGRGIVLLLLIPYAALGITLAALYLMCLFANKTNGKRFSKVECFHGSLQQACRACLRQIREQATSFRPRSTPKDPNYFLRL